MTNSLFNTYRDKLLTEHDFGVFSQIAAGDLDPDTHPGRASELEDLLEQTVDELRKQPPAVSGEAIREALIYYIKDVWPLRKAAGLDKGAAADLAEQAGIMSSMPSSVMKRIEEDWSSDSETSTSGFGQPVDLSMRDADRGPPETTDPSDHPKQGSLSNLPAPIDGFQADGKPEEQAPDDPKEPDASARPLAEAAASSDKKSGGGDPPNSAPETGKSTGAADQDKTEPPKPKAAPAPPPRPPQSNRSYKEANVNFDQIAERIFNAREKGRNIIVILGLETAGKTFFVRRLGHTLDDYTVLNIHGGAVKFGMLTNRTKGIVYYSLNSSAETQRELEVRPHLDLFDLPGEWFRDLAGANDSGSISDEQKMELCAVLAAADMCIVVEPAMQVLAPDIYRDSGDFAAELEIGDYIKEAQQAGNADPQNYAEEKARQKRLETVELVEEFHDNFEAVRRRIFNLRELAEEAIAERSADQLKTALKEYIDKAFVELEEIDGPLPIPGLLLLSRTDDYVARAAADDDRGTVDPAYSLAARGKAKYQIYSRAFSLFGVDFITANKPAPDVLTRDPIKAREYDKFAENAGVANILDDWILPAIHSTKSSGSMSGALRSPGKALRLRGMLDRNLFRSAWLNSSSNRRRKSGPLPVENSQSRLHGYLSGVARWTKRHPRASGLASLLPALLVLCAFFAIPLYGLWSTESLDNTGSSIELIAPGDLDRREYREVIAEATRAERDKIAEMAFVLKPPPHSMPVMQGQVPGLNDGTGFARLVDRMTAIGCADNAGQVNYRPDIDESRVADLQSDIAAANPGASGLALLRQNYHLGLLAFCRGDFADAQRSFGRVVDAVNPADDAALVGGPIAEQFGFVSTAGYRMALVQNDRAAQVEMPALPNMPAALSSGQTCRQESSGNDCRLFQWPALRSDLSRVHEFLAIPDADPEDFRESILNGFDGDDNLVPYNYSAFVAAHAKAGEFALVRERVRSAVRLKPVWEQRFENTCNDIDRIARLGWIAGMEERDLDACDAPPFTSDVTAPDLDRVTAWYAIRDGREALLESNLERAQATLAPADEGKSDEDAFRERVRAELFGRIADRLDDRLDEARSNGEADTEANVINLLRSEYFSLPTRLGAQLTASWGNLWIALGIAAFLAALFFALGWVLRNILIGYAFAFTQRHYRETQQLL